MQNKTNFKRLGLIACITIMASCHKTFDHEAQMTSTSIQSDVSGANQNRPNVIVILVDDMGYEIPNYTGGQSFHTPNIDALAASGIQFTDCRSQPLCTPSRIELLTGKYNFRNTNEESWGVLDPSESTIASMMRNNGYKTCIAGKWQLDGGAASINSLGFDQHCVTNPFLKGTGADSAFGGEREKSYKNPYIYQDGNYLAQNIVKGKYGEDIIRNYLLGFINTNKNRRFFALWTPNLIHRPYCPTPDDPEFDSWNPDKKGTMADSVFFPSMVKYMDKQIGILRDSLAAMNLLDKTLILFLGDNGTAGTYAMFNGQTIRGAKGTTLEYGIHVPFIASMPGRISPNQVNHDLIDFTDFFVSIADVAGINSSTSYGTLDGVSFAPQLRNETGVKRTHSYSWYQDNRTRLNEVLPPTCWVQDHTYKLYKESNGAYRFYNFITDPYEQAQILPENFNSTEDERYNFLKAALAQYP
jgi:arylsulfatase A